MITNQENMSTWARRVLTGLTQTKVLMATHTITTKTIQKFVTEQKKEK